MNPNPSQTPLIGDDGELLKADVNVSPEASAKPVLEPQKRQHSAFNALWKHIKKRFFVYLFLTILLGFLIINMSPGLFVFMILLTMFVIRLWGLIKQPPPWWQRPE